MKCKNCGAHYKTRELKCPYCNTENLIGKIWQSERSQAELDYEEEKKKVGKILLSPYMAERLLNRTIFILIGLYVVSFLTIVLVIALSFPIEDLIFSMNKEKIEAQMEEYYQAGEYELLDIYMTENYVERKDYYKYNQVTSMQFDYNSYMAHRLAFENMSKEEQLEDDYHLKYAIRSSVEVYNCECGDYSDIDSDNASLLENRKKEIMAYWIGELLLTEEEIQEILEADRAWNVDVEKFMEIVKERRCR